MRCWGEIDEEPVLVWSLAPARHVHLYKTPGLISFPFSKPVRARWAPIQTETVRPITRHQLPSVRPRASLHPATRKHLTCSYFSPWPMSPYPTTPLTYLAPALIRSTLLVKTALPSSLSRPVAQGSMSPRVSHATPIQPLKTTNSPTMLLPLRTFHVLCHVLYLLSGCSPLHSHCTLRSMPVPVPSEQVGPVRRGRLTIDMRPTPSDASRSTIQNPITDGGPCQTLFGCILGKFIARGCWLGVFVSANKYSNSSDLTPEKATRCLCHLNTHTWKISAEPLKADVAPNMENGANTKRTSDDRDTSDTRSEPAQ